MGKREKQQSVEWKCFLPAVGKMLIFEFILYAVMLLLLSLLIYKGVLQIEPGSVLLCLLWGNVAFATTSMASFVVKQNVLATALAAQALFLLLFLVIGLAFCGTTIRWFGFFVAILSTFLASLLAAFLFVGRKRKKFQKNAPLRLKKK